MITHCHKEVKEKLSSLLHFHLHGATPFECRPAPDDQSQIMSTQSGFRIGSVGIGISSAREDCAALDAGLEALLAKCQTLKFGEAVFLGSTTVTGHLSARNETFCASGRTH